MSSTPTPFNTCPITGWVSLDAPRLQQYFGAQRVGFPRGREYLEHVIASTNSILDRARPQFPPRGGLTIVRGLDGRLSVSDTGLHAYGSGQLANDRVTGMTGEQVADGLVNALTEAAVRACEHVGIPHPG
jgi:hypothetical protein